MDDALPIIFLLFTNFSYQFLTIGFPLESEWNKSLQMSGSFQIILTDFSNAVVWMLSILPLIFYSSSFFFILFRIVQKSSTTNGIIVPFIFLNFFTSLVA